MSQRIDSDRSPASPRPPASLSAPVAAPVAPPVAAPLAAPAAPDGRGSDRSFRSALARVLDTVVAPCAERAARHDAFPRSSVDALGRAGLLGLTASAELGGGGQGVAEAAEVVAEVARACPATAAVLRSHYAAAAVIEAHGTRWLRGELAAGRHLSTLALSDQTDGAEPAPTATRYGNVVALRGCKRPVVAAGEADSYVWSSRALDGAEGLTLWLVPAFAPGLFVPFRPDGDAPRGSATSTVRADPARIPAAAQLGGNGLALETVLDTVTPWLAAHEAAAEAAAEAEAAAVPSRA
ncbi:acyl-CoA dehydrogenase family protein [Phaeacidiphilus oryzae]|uniref:acyl-CoA dehydrogenase family protein n=1 Tax=Phaeacidiphilus oryzae TaxID=348818 RepID=UPI0007C76DD3|nr:acyl-CoA dehydrogenase family protein [Phaeacidiphilus oryzae]